MFIQFVYYSNALPTEEYLVDIASSIIRGEYDSHEPDGYLNCYHASAVFPAPLESIGTVVFRFVEITGNDNNTFILVFLGERFAALSNQFILKRVHNAVIAKENIETDKELDVVIGVLGSAVDTYSLEFEYMSHTNESLIYTFPRTGTNAVQYFLRQDIDNTKRMLSLVK